MYVLQMTILLRMDDKMNRQLTCPVSQTDTSMLLAQELVHFGFINEVNFCVVDDGPRPMYEKRNRLTRTDAKHCERNLRILGKLNYCTNQIFFVISILDASQSKRTYILY